MVRAGKHPLEFASAPTTLSQDIIGTNSGNMLFQEAVIKTLSVDGAEIDVTRNRLNLNDVDRINEQYDGFVVPLANAFRPAFESKLRQLTDFIEKLTIPVTVVGVGVQTDYNYTLSNLTKIDEATKRFVSTVLSKSASIGVRGQVTADYLKHLGFSDVEIIGCPSMFMHGQDFKLNLPKQGLNKSSKLGLSLSSTGTQAAFSDSLAKMGKVFERNIELYKNSTYVAQEGRSLDQLLWSTNRSVVEHDAIRPGLFEELVRADRARFFVDPREWSKFGSSLDFAFGTRLHGAIAVLLGGTPAHLIAHDSRTRELAEYFQIPFTSIYEVSENVTAEELYKRSDFSGLLDGHKDRFETYSKFMSLNGLPNSFETGDNKSFEDKLKVARLSEPVTGLPTLTITNDKIDFVHQQQASLKTSLSKKTPNLAERALKKFAKVLLGRN